MSAGDPRHGRNRAQDELRLGAQVYEVFLDSLAELLALRVTAKEAGRQVAQVMQEQREAGGAPGVRAPSVGELRNLAFDFAQLQVQNLRQLAALGRNHTEFLRQRLDARSEDDRSRRSDRRRRDALVELELSVTKQQYRGDFAVVNATKSEQPVIFPHVLTFRASDGTESFFVACRFQPEDLVLAAGAEKDVLLIVDAEPFAPGVSRYLAQTSIALGGEKTLELFVQLSPPERP